MNPNEGGLIFCLLETTSDCSDVMLDAVRYSLVELGMVHPQLVLTSIYNYRNTDRPLNDKAKICLFTTTKNIINEMGATLEDKTIIQLWATKSKDLLIAKTASPALEAEAADLLVIILANRIEQDFVFTELLDTITVNEIPSFAIISTLSHSLVCPKDAHPFFKDILEKIVPNINLIKQENLRTMTIALFGKLAQGVLEVTADASLDDELNMVEYQDNFALAYDCFLNNWFKSSNFTLKSLIVEVTGYMSRLLSNEKLKEYGAVTVHTILAHYKKNTNPFILSFALAQFCNAMVDGGAEECLKCQVENILATLINQACATLDYNDITTVKNYGEVLRCYEILSRCFPENVISQVLQRLENASHVQRSGALAVLKHLVYNKRIPETFMKKIFTNLDLVLPDLNSKVVKNMSQLILALGNKGHLSYETGRPFMDYLVQHAARGRLEPEGRIDLADVCNEPAKDVCCESLILLATIPSAVPILWPHMLQYLVNPQYEESLPVTVKCLANLASLDVTKASDEGPSVFEQLNPPIVPEVLVVKLLTLSCLPNGAPAGVDCLDLLNGLGSHISPDVVKPWAEHLQPLKTQYNELCLSTSEPMALEKFQSSLKHFLESTVIAINKENFLENLVTAVKNDLERHDKNQSYRCFLMSLMGVCLKYLTNITLTTSTLEFLYNLVNHKSSADQECFGTVVGMCASTNSTVVFSKIEAWLKAIDNIKRSILSMLKAQDSRLEEQTFLKISIVHCLGQIAVLADNDKVEEIVGGPVMLHLLNIINNNKIDIVNDTVMHSISKISRSLVKIPDMKLRQRPIIITHIVNTMKQDDISIVAIASCLQAMRDIVALQPVLDVEERSLVLQTSIASCLGKLNVTSGTELDPNLINCYSILNVLIRTVVQHDPHLSTLEDLINLLRPSMNAASKTLRVKAVDLIHSSLCTFQQNVVVSQNSTFAQKPIFLAILAPRLNDSSMHVKVQAMACLRLIVLIADMYHPDTGPTQELALECIQTLQDNITCTDDNTISSNLKLMGDVISYKLTVDEIFIFIQNVDIGLQDKDDDGACGVGQIMSAIFSARGHQMQHFYPKNILEPIYRRLQKVDDPSTRFYAVEAIFNYAQYKVTRFSNILSTFPIPFEPAICETFQRMGGNTEMCVNLLIHFTQVLERTPPYAYSNQNPGDGERQKIANLLPLSVICAMKEMFSFSCMRNNDDERGVLLQLAVEDADVNNTKTEIHENFASLFPLLLLWYGSYVDCLAPLHQSSPSDSSPGFIPNRNATNLVPARCVLECIRTYLTASGYCEELEDTLDILLEVPEIDSFETFHASIPDIVTDFVNFAQERVSSFVAYLDTHHTYEVQRMTVACVFGTLISLHCNSDYDLLKIVISSLINRIHDEDISVRRIAILGLATFNPQMVPENFEKNADVLSTLVAAAELKNKANFNLSSEVIVEALTGLSILLQNYNFDLIEPHAATLFSKARMFSEKPPQLRDGAMLLLYGLVQSVEPSDEYKQTIHSHLLGVLIHLMDPHVPVAVTCARILLTVHKHLQSEELAKKFKRHVSLTRQTDYPSFIHDISVDLVEELGNYTPIFVQSAIEYYRHSHSAMRKAAVILTAYLVNSGAELDLVIVTKASQGLIPLLKDCQVDVASAAAHCISLYKGFPVLL